MQKRLLTLGQEEGEGGGGGGGVLNLHEPLAALAPSKSILSVVCCFAQSACATVAQQLPHNCPATSDQHEKA